MVEKQWVGAEGETENIAEEEGRLNKRADERKWLEMKVQKGQKRG